MFGFVVHKSEINSVLCLEDPQKERKKGGDENMVLWVEGLGSQDDLQGLFESVLTFNKMLSAENPSIQAWEGG